MPLAYNFGQRGIIIPNVLSRKYKYTKLDEIYELTMDDGSKVTINIRKRIGGAWKYLEDQCAKNNDCNKYFVQLRKKKTLADILKNITFTVHRLAPKEGRKEEELPAGNSAGTDFALSLFGLLDADTTEALAATILHEIAHYAGATTNPGDENALEAENALTHCGLKRFFSKEAKG